MHSGWGACNASCADVKSALAVMLGSIDMTQFSKTTSPPARLILIARLQYLPSQHDNRDLSADLATTEGCGLDLRTLNLTLAWVRFQLTHLGMKQASFDTGQNGR